MTWQKEWKTTEPSVEQIQKAYPELNNANREIIGDLALDFTDEGWNIYHVPTGACFDAAVPLAMTGIEFDKDKLLNWMKKVQEANPTAWTMLRLLKPDTYATNGTAAKKIIQEWCLNVRVE